MNIFINKKDRLIRGFFLFVVIYEYLSFLYKGVDVGNHQLTINMFIIFIGIVYMILSTHIRRISIKEFRLILLFLIPITSLTLIQLFLFHQLDLLKSLLIVFTNIFLAFLINRYLGFLTYTKILRWLVFLNIFFILAVGLLGNIMIDDTVTEEHVSNLYMTWNDFSIAIASGAWGEDFIRTGGLFGHPNRYALMAAVGVIGLYYQKSTVKTRLFWWIVFFISFIPSESRAAFLFLVTFYMIWRFFSQRRLLDMCINLFLLVSIFLAGVFLATLRVSNYVDTDITSGRADIMDSVLRSFTTSLDTVRLWGMGLGNVQQYLYHDIGLLLPIDNGYISLFVEFGIIGCLIFSSALIYIWYYAQKNSFYKVREWLPFLCAVVIYSLFESDLSLTVISVSIHWIIFLFYMVHPYDSTKIKFSSVRTMTFEKETY